MSKDNADKVVGRFKQAGFSDEFVSEALRPEVLSNTHTDLGSGHSDFPRHQDLHLDMPRAMTPTEAIPLSASLELREALNEWIRLLSDRVAQLERRVASLEGK